MQQVDEELWYSEEKIETLHVYLVPDQPAQPRRHFDTLIAFLGLCFLVVVIVALCALPASAASTIQTLRLPAHLRPLSLQASIQIVPTGTHTYPATQAAGVLTIYNGSFLSESLPAGFILTTSSGGEVQTDQAITIPAGNPPASYGTTTVPAHAAAGGVAGDIPALSINQTYGSALYIKNLSAFTGGHDAYTESYTTSSDITTALDSARAQLSARQPAGLTTGCDEKTAQKKLILAVSWVCNYVVYQVPKGAQIVSVRVSGNMVVLSIRVARHRAASYVVR